MSTFGKKVTSAVLTSAVVFSTVAAGTVGASAAFTNVEAANKLAGMNVIVDQSTTPASYRLADTIQRQEALKVMMKLSGNAVSQEACTSPFADIADSDWACKYAVAALEAGFITKNDNFRPSDKVSKIEALKMVMQARGIAKSDATDWRAAYVESAVTAGIAGTFADYNTAAERGTVFVWAAEAIEVAEDDSTEEVATEDETSDLISDLIGGLGDDEEAEIDEETETETETETEVTVSGEDELTVSLNPETPSDGLAQANTARVPFLVFDVTAGSEDVTLNQATLEFIGLGDYKFLDDVSIYNSKGEKVSKTKSFTEVTKEISFDNDIVVEAGTTMTLTVAGKITTNGDTNATYGIKLVDIEASSDVMGDTLVGALLVPAVFANVASLEVKADKASGKVTVGETEVLAGFEIEEKNDNENVIIKTITMHLAGTVDEDDVSDLVLYADGEELTSDLTVNSDDEIVASIDYELTANEKVDFELKGTIVGSVDSTIDVTFESSDDIYAVGATSAMPVSLTTAITSTSSVDISDLRDIEGSEINVSFEKGDVDEAKPDAEDVLVGNLNFLSITDGYEVKKIEVTVTNTNTAQVVNTMVEDIQLDGSSFDGTANVVSDAKVTYTFEDINLKANEELSLPLTFDIANDTAYNGTNLDFKVNIIEIESDDDTYTVGTAPLVSTILSSTALDSKDIDIETASFEISNIGVIDRELVLGNGVETVLYKAKISIGDADSVVINDMDFVETATTNLSEDLDKVIDKATLNIGGQTFDADISSTKVEFSGINAEIAAGSDNVEVLVTAVLKDNDSVSTGEFLKLQLDTSTLDLEDSDSDDLLVGSIVIASANNKLTTTTLQDHGTFEFAIINDGDNKDDINNVVLAGTTNVALAEYRMEADLEDMDVNSLKIRIPATVTGGADAGEVITTAEATTTANVVGVTGAPEVTEMTFTSNVGGVSGNIQVNHNGLSTVVSIAADATADAVATAVQAAINTPATADSASVSSNVVTITAAANGPQTDASINGGSTFVTSTTNVTTQGVTTVNAVKEVKTITFSRAITAEDVVNVNGVAAATPTIAEVATLLATDADTTAVATSATVITLTAATAGTPNNILAITSTPFPAIAGVVTGDFSDSLTDVRLMDGSTVIVDGGVVTYDSTNNETVIEFKDFTVEDGEDRIEGTIVADIRSYTTNGSETSAVLGDIAIKAFDAANDADVDGASSDDAIVETAATGNVSDKSEAVSLVPALVTVSIDNTLGTDDQYSSLTFTVDKGNNVLEEDDIKLTSFNLESDADLALRDDDSNSVLLAGSVTAGFVDLSAASNTDFVSGDSFEFKATNAADPIVDSEIRIVEDSIKFSIDVDGNGTIASNEIFTVDTNGVLDLGTYAK